jgi:hypothetical protein
VRQGEQVCNVKLAYSASLFVFYSKTGCAEAVLELAFQLVGFLVLYYLYLVVL